ncbi:MAG: FAD-dependent oxidoreductase, partial [Duncaniella sp.]|nr:FAD-dependent oxidoreductase [Duncaniella sp.]
MLTKPRLVILGGGFTGLNLVKHIDKNKYDVTLIDRNNYHSFPPLFYQVASSGLDPTSISFPLRREIRKAADEGARFHMGNVTSVDVKAKTVTTSSGVIPYDKLVLAMGTTNNFFGNDDLLYDVYT